jgi:hypothetical protein
MRVVVVVLVLQLVSVRMHVLGAVGMRVIVRVLGVFVLVLVIGMSVPVRVRRAVFVSVFVQVVGRVRGHRSLLPIRASAHFWDIGNRAKVSRARPPDPETSMPG